MEHGVSARSGQLAVEFWYKVQGTGRIKEQERHDALYPEP
jgi:hypothetical protein